MRSRVRSVRPTHHGVVLSLGGLLLAISLLMALGQGPAVAQSRHSGPALHSYRFDAPTSAAVVGSHLFATNRGRQRGDRDHHLRRVLRGHPPGPHFGFDAPAAIVAVGLHLFVANSGGNSVSEFSAAHHTHIRTIRGPTLSDPIALASTVRSLSVVLNGAGSLTEFATATGALIATASGPTFGFDDPTGLAAADGRSSWTTVPPTPSRWSAASAWPSWQRCRDHLSLQHPHRCRLRRDQCLGDQPGRRVGDRSPPAPPPKS